MFFSLILENAAGDQIDMTATANQYMTYRGLRKQTAKLNIMFALANLYLADRFSVTA